VSSSFQTWMDGQLILINGSEDFEKGEKGVENE
jgi:hypothetical protein